MSSGSPLIHSGFVWPRNDIIAPGIVHAKSLFGHLDDAGRHLVQPVAGVPQVLEYLAPDVIEIAARVVGIQIVRGLHELALGISPIGRDDAVLNLLPD